MKYSVQLLLVAVCFLGLGFFIAGIVAPAKETACSQCPSEEEFAPFLKEFHANVVFQKQRTLFPLMYITASDPEVSALDTFLIERSQWSPFSIFDSVGTLITLQPSLPGTGLHHPCNFTVTLQGLHHGEQVSFDFVNTEGEWMLQTFRDFSL